MTLEIVLLNSAVTIIKYNDYKGIIPSIGDDMSIENIDCNINHVTVKDKYFFFDENGLRGISLWVK
jgi:hypothetical protein